MRGLIPAFCFAGAGSLLATGLVLSISAAAAEDLLCERQTVAVLVSPENIWVALVEEGVCVSGPVTVSTDTVRLVRRNSTSQILLAPRPEKPEQENDVLVVDYYGHAENRPNLRWLSPGKLQITIPNISAVGMQKTTYQGVDVVIKYEPDDPAAREKWRKERGLPVK
jgi:hypothetical protein